MNKARGIFLAVLFSLMLVAVFNGREAAAEPSTDAWAKTYGGTGDEYAMTLIQTDDGGYALAGQTCSFGAGGWDFWLVKTDENGVVPEFPSVILLALFMMATILAAALLRKGKHFTI